MKYLTSPPFPTSLFSLANIPSTPLMNRPLTFMSHLWVWIRTLDAKRFHALTRLLLFIRLRCRHFDWCDKMLRVSGWEKENYVSNTMRKRGGKKKRDREYSRMLAVSSHQFEALGWKLISDAGRILALASLMFNANYEVRRVYSCEHAVTLKAESYVFRDDLFVWTNWM